MTAPTAKIDPSVKIAAIAAEIGVATVIVVPADLTRAAAATKAAAAADTVADSKRTLAIGPRALMAAVMIVPGALTAEAATTVRADPGVIDPIVEIGPKAAIDRSAIRIKATAPTANAKIGRTVSEMTGRALIKIVPGLITTVRAPKEKAAGIAPTATVNPADSVRAGVGSNLVVDSKRALAAANRADSGADLSLADSAEIVPPVKAATVRKVGLAADKATASVNQITGRDRRVAATAARKMAVRAADSAAMKKARAAATIDRQ